MCLAKAYIDSDKGGEIVLEDVALLTLHDGKIQLQTLFGEQEEIEGTIKEIDFQGAKILVEKK